MCAVNLKVTSKIPWVFSNTTDEVIIFMYLGFDTKTLSVTGLEEYWPYKFKVNAATVKGNETSDFSSVFRTKQARESILLFFFFKPVFIFLPWATSDMTIVTYVPIWQVWFRITNIICFANIIHARTLNISHLYKAS